MYHARVSEPAPPPTPRPTPATGAPPRFVVRTLVNDPLIASLVRWLLIIITVYVAWSALAYLAAILWPVVVALAVAYMLDPVLERLVTRGMSRAMAARLLLLLFAGGIAAIATVVVLYVPAQVQHFIDGLPAMLARAHELSMEYFQFDLQSHLNADELRGILENTLGPVDHLAALALGGAFSILALVVELLLVMLFAYYLLLEWSSITGRLMRIVPPRRRTYVSDVFAEIDNVVSGWVRGQAIVTGLLAMFYAVAFWAIGVPLAIPLGLVVGGLTIIPFIGTFVGLAVTSVVVVLNWPDPGAWQLGTDLAWNAHSGVTGATLAGAVGGVFVVLHLLEAAVLTPKIVGHKVGLSESAALFAVLAGGKLLGFIGILLAVPLAATAAVLIRHAVRRYEKTHFFGEEADAIVPVTPAMALMMTQEEVAGTVRVDGETDDEVSKTR